MLSFPKVGHFPSWAVLLAADHFPETEHIPKPGHIPEAEGFPEFYRIPETDHFPEFDHFYENEPVWKRIIIRNLIIVCKL